MHDDRDRHEQQHELRGRAQPPPPQQRADDRPAKEIDVRNRFVRRHRAVTRTAGRWRRRFDARCARRLRASRRPAAPSHPAWESERHIVHARPSARRRLRARVPCPGATCVLRASPVRLCTGAPVGSRSVTVKVAGPTIGDVRARATMSRAVVDRRDASSAAGEADRQRHDPEHRAESAGGGVTPRRSTPRRAARTRTVAGSSPRRAGTGGSTSQSPSG